MNDRFASDILDAILERVPQLRFDQRTFLDATYIYQLRYMTQSEHEELKIYACGEAVKVETHKIEETFIIHNPEFPDNVVRKIKELIWSF